MNIRELAIKGHDMKEIRCKKCRRLLMKGEIQHIEIKCPKCGHIQKFKAEGGEKNEVIKH